MMKSRLFFLLLCIALLLDWNGYSEANIIGEPIIQNFPPKTYQAHGQNWAITQDGRGFIYVGNLEGILEFDGSHWKLILVGNKSVARSLITDASGRVYVGAISDFGYLAYDRQGNTQYCSLSNQLPPAEQNFNDVWSIHHTTHGIYFVTSEKTFRWHENSLTVIDCKTPFFQGYTAFDSVYSQNENGHIGIIQNGRYQVLITDPLLNSGRAIFLPYRQNQLLIVSEKMGFYLLNNLPSTDLLPALTSAKNIVLSPFANQVSAYLVENSLMYGAIVLKSGHYAFSTRRGGILIMDGSGSIVQIINEANGLQNNNVNQTFQDQENNLWAALNNGISHIIMNSPLKQFSKYSGFTGNLLSIVCHQQNVYLGSFNYIYYLGKGDYNQDRFFPIESSVGVQCFDFFSADKLLFAAGKGLFLVKDQQAIRLNKEVQFICMNQSSRFPDYLFIGAYPGFYALQLTKDIKDLSENILSAQKRTVSADFIQFKEILEPIYTIVGDDQGNLWFTSIYNGIYYLEFLSDSIRNYKLHHFTDKDGLPENKFNFVNMIHNRLILTTMQGIYTIDQSSLSNHDKIRFVPENTFGQLFNQPAIGTKNIHLNTDGSIWINTDSGFGVIKKDTKSTVFFWESIPFKPIRFPIQNYYPLPNKNVWLVNFEETAHYFDSSILKNYQPDYSAFIREVVINNTQTIFHGSYFQSSSRNGNFYLHHDSSQPSETKPVLDYRQNSLTIKFSAAFYEYMTETHYCHQLQGFDSGWSTWQKDTKAIYTNLYEGNYTFLVKAKNIFDHPSRTTSYSFTIQPPWYRSPLAYGVYFLIFLSLLYGGIHLNTFRLRAAKKRLEKIVSERTKEVLQQKEAIENYAQELSTANQTLIETKDALWGEMELAKKIQTVLLPKEPCIPGLEISAYMKPADEVGGDYYDVICIDNNDRRGGSCARPKDSGQPQGADPQRPNMGNHKGLPLQIYQPLSTNHQPPTTAPEPSYWLSIGDVSGHGVPAGLIMMMVQTSIHTALQIIPHAPPDAILAYVNRIIHQNIRKMGEDKYMTINIISYAGHGVFYFSGLHQDIMIYRNSDHQVETIETRGMWLGLTDQIATLLPVDSITLQPGDIMLLYTDGIPEAMDNFQQMYSSEKLCRLLQENGQKPLSKIKETILASLSNYTCHDDITFMLIKRI
jgi:serine phosphatase RsbU (regulator of sigma subunit)/ligand-binding sensor domain-containing protein